MPQTQSISKACFISILKSGIPLLVLKGTKDTPATALCGGRSRIRKRSWQNRSCFPLLCRGHALGFVQEGQRLLKSLTEGGFGCLVTPRTVLNFIYRKKKNIMGKKNEHNIRFLFKYPIWDNVEAATCQPSTAQGRQEPSPGFSSHLYSDSQHALKVLSSI